MGEFIPTFSALKNATVKGLLKLVHIRETFIMIHKYACPVFTCEEARRIGV